MTNPIGSCGPSAWLSYRLSWTGVALLAALAVAGCGDSEVAERKAFITFLQERVIAPSGLRIPKPNADSILAKAEAARSGLQQADDLKAVYTRAFEKAVVTPAGIFRTAFPPLDEGFQAIDNFAELLEQNRGRFKLSGNTFEVTDPKLHARISAALAEMNAKGRQVNEAQRLMQAALR